MNFDVSLENPSRIPLNKQWVVHLLIGKAGVTLGLVGCWSLFAKSFKNLEQFVLRKLKSQSKTRINEVIFKDKSYVFRVVGFVGLFDWNIKALQLLSILRDQNLGSIGSLGKLDAATLNETINKIEVGNFNFFRSQRVTRQLLILRLHLDSLFWFGKRVPERVELVVWEDQAHLVDASLHFDLADCAAGVSVKLHEEIKQRHVGCS